MGRTLVALDVGSANLRAVRFSASKSSPRVDKIALAPLPAGTVVSGEVRDPQALTAAVKQLWAEHRLGETHVVLGIANNAVAIREVELERLSRADFDKSLKYQVGDYIQVPIDEANLAYHVLSEYQSPDTDGRGSQPMVRILLVVVSDAIVASLVDPLRAAGLTPVKMDLTPFSLIRAAQPSVADGPDARAVIDIGADVTNVVVHQGGQPRFVRILVGYGGNSVTASIAAELRWSAERAEDAKLAAGAGHGHPAPGERDIATEVIAAGRATIVAEIRSALDYFLATNGVIPTLSGVVLTGGGSLLTGLPEQLAEELRVPVRAGTPLHAVRASKRCLRDATADSQFAVALGLTMGAA